MANKHCFYCKHYHSESQVQDGFNVVMKIFRVPKYKIVPAHCDLDNKKCMKWWKENGHLPLSEAKDLECFEPTQAQVMFDDFCDDMENILEKLKQVNNENIENSSINSQTN